MEDPVNLSNHTLFKNIPEEDAITMSDFKDAWDKLSIHHSGLFMYHNERIMVPKNARNFIIRQIHRSHSGISKSLRRFYRDYWWFNYSKDIEN